MLRTIVGVKVPDSGSGASVATGVADELAIGVEVGVAVGVDVGVEVPARIPLDELLTSDSALLDTV